LCLVHHGKKNAKYQLLWNDEMQNAEIFMGVFSYIQNAKFFMGWVSAFWLFGFLWPLEAKIRNKECIPFYQNFCMAFSSILQNNRSKSFFLMKRETKHTLRYYNTKNSRPHLQYETDVVPPHQRRPCKRYDIFF
jgi:hypothetical protein